MSKKIEARLPRGMRDILPEKMIRRQYVIGVVSRVFEEYGYEPLQTPSMERAETLMGKYGPDAEKLIYQARHRGGKEDLALRYDLSVPLCRVIGMHGDLQKPFKRYQISPVWRAERPQRGRYREFYQCDCDTVGSSEMLADAETMCVVSVVLERLGFKRFCIHFNNRKILNGIGQFAGVPTALLAGLYRSIDKLDKIGPDGVKKELRENRIPSSAVDRLMDLLRTEGENRELLSNLKQELGDHEEAVEGISELEEIIDHLDTMGVASSNYSVRFAMVRGLDYYTGPIYETAIEEPPMPSITGGGRYDRLIGTFAKNSLPAVGTSFGIERIIDAMEELDMFPSDVGRTVVQVLVTIFDPELTQHSLRAAQRLRAAGLNTELYFRASKLKAQFRYAHRKGIPYVLVLGPDEVEKGLATIRDFDHGEQSTLPLEQVSEKIRDWERARQRASS